MLFMSGYLSSARFFCLALLFGAFWFSPSRPFFCQQLYPVEIKFYAGLQYKLLLTLAEAFHRHQLALLLLLYPDQLCQYFLTSWFSFQSHVQCLQYRHHQTKFLFCNEIASAISNRFPITYLDYLNSLALLNTFNIHTLHSNTLAYAWSLQELPEC